MQKLSRKFNMNTLFKHSEKSVYGLPFYTWSEQWVRKLSLLGEELSNLETTVINIDPNEPYGFTYAALSDTVLSPSLRDVIDKITDMLIKLNPSQGIMMFEKLLFDKFNTQSLHNLFSLLSRSLTNKQELTNSISFHSPIKPELFDKGFPVHADLFKARAILNVISRTDDFDGGDILLISFKGLSDAMDATDSMPISVSEYIKEVLQTRMLNDAFDSIYNLIHGEHPWVNDLRIAIESKQFRIPGMYGVGYFIIDGQWLHGRTKIQGPVSETRLQRLVFDTKYTISLRSTSPAKVMEDDWLQTHANNNVIYKAQKSLPNKPLHPSYRGLTLRSSGAAQKAAQPA